MEAFGCLDYFSSFPFESFMQDIRRAVTSKSMVAQHIFIRVKERMSRASLCDKLKALDDIASYSIRGLPSRVPHMVVGSVVITQECPNNVILVNDRPSLIERINGNQLLIRSFRKSAIFLRQTFAFFNLVDWMPFSSSLSWLVCSVKECCCHTNVVMTSILRCTIGTQHSAYITVSDDFSSFFHIAYSLILCFHYGRYLLLNLALTGLWWYCATHV